MVWREIHLLVAILAFHHKDLLAQKTEDLNEDNTLSDTESFYMNMKLILDLVV